MCMMRIVSVQSELGRRREHESCDVKNAVGAQSMRWTGAECVTVITGHIDVVPCR